MLPDSASPISVPSTARGRPRRRRVAGFTLLEAMLSTTIFTMVTLGVYTILIKSYQMIALSRCRDEARAVLRTYADQFLRLQTTERVSGATYNRWLFNPTNGPSGRGLRWGELSDRNTSTAATDVALVLLDGRQRIIHVEAEPEFNDRGHVDVDGHSVTCGLQMKIELHLSQ